MTPTLGLVEAFYERAAPLGVALFGPRLGLGLTFGRPSKLVLSRLPLTDGYQRADFRGMDLSIFTATLDGDWSDDEESGLGIAGGRLADR